MLQRFLKIGALKADPCSTNMFSVGQSGELFELPWDAAATELTRQEMRIAALWIADLIVRRRRPPTANRHSLRYLSHLRQVTSTASCAYLMLKSLQMCSVRRLKGSSARQCALEESVRLWTVHGLIRDLCTPGEGMGAVRQALLRVLTPMEGSGLDIKKGT